LNLDTIIVNSLVVIKTSINSRVYKVDPRNYHSLSYRIHGLNVLYDGEKEITSHTGTLTFVPAGKPYIHNVMTPSQQIVAHFTTKEAIGDSIENFILPPRCNIEGLFYSLYNRWEIEQRENNLPCMSIFYNILALIAKNTKGEITGKRDGFIRDSVVYMHEHFKESDFNINKLYERMYISPAYYRRKFKEIYRCSPVEYLKNLRINYAKQLLEIGYYTISEIAELSGFSTPAYFSYEFKRITGYTPMQYRCPNPGASLPSDKR
jgi:AraC-like DNA-binding protein